MSDDVLMHLSSNSNPSDPSLPTKLAKLEARMAGKSPSSASSIQSAWQPAQPAKPGRPEELPGPPSSSDSEDDNGGEFLIQANTRKRQRVEENRSITVLQHSEEATDGRIRVAEIADIRSGLEDINRKKQGRGRGRFATGKGRGSKTSDQIRSSLSSSTVLLSNGQLEDSLHKENWSREHIGNDERASVQEEITLLRGKVVALEVELNKARQEIADHQQIRHELEKEMKDLKERDQQTKTKRIKVLSDLLISVSKAERQEARLKVRQESLRLGNVGVLR